MGGTLVCQGCPAGKACPSPTSPATMIVCPAGTYAIVNKTKCEVCPAGKQCPSTTAATVNNCANGHYSRGGLQACVRCEAGD